MWSGSSVSIFLSVVEASLAWTTEERGTGEGEDRTGEDLGPFEDGRPLDAVLGKTRGVGDGADRKGGGRSVHVEL